MEFSFAETIPIVVPRPPTSKAGEEENEENEREEASITDPPLRWRSISIYKHTACMWHISCCRAAYFAALLFFSFLGLAASVGVAVSWGVSVASMPRFSSTLQQFNTTHSDVSHQEI